MLRPKLPAATSTEEALRLPHGKYERPRDHEAAEPGEKHRAHREDGRQDQGCAIGGIDVVAQPGHSALLRLDELSDAHRDVVVEALQAIEKRSRHGAELAIPDRIGHVGHRGHRVVLRGADLLDETVLLGRRLRLQARERAVEAVVLAQDPRDRGLLLRKQRECGEVHLSGQRILDLLGRVDPLMRLIEQPTLSRRAHLRQQARHGHRDEQQRDDQEAGQKLGMDGGANGRHPPHQPAERKPVQELRGDLLELDFLSLG